jgi:DNA-binding CsgD family transcriptional regulator
LGGLSVPRGLPATIALFVVVGVQVICTLFFVWDIVAGVAGLRREPMAWETRELLEMGAAVGLVLGVMLGAILLARTIIRNRAVEGRLRQVSGAFAALLEERFGQWGLTRSERDVAWFTIKGLSIAEIARLRGTSEGTVKAHSNAIYRKAGVSGRTQLLSLFIEDLMDEAPDPIGSRTSAWSPSVGGEQTRRAACRRRSESVSHGLRPHGGRHAMEKLEIGDLVVLGSGSMRMAVEAIDGDQVSCVWCHEGAIGRDAFDARLLKKWEFREEERPARAKPYRAEHEGGGKPYRPRGEERDVKPRGKPGWDGKPREKKFFRKDG